MIDSVPPACDHCLEPLTWDVCPFCVQPHPSNGLGKCGVCNGKRGFWRCQQCDPEPDIHD